MSYLLEIALQSVDGQLCTRNRGEHSWEMVNLGLLDSFVNGLNGAWDSPCSGTFTTRVDGMDVVARFTVKAVEPERWTAVLRTNIGDGVLTTEYESAEDVKNYLIDTYADLNAEMVWKSPLFGWARFPDNFGLLVTEEFEVFQVV